MASLWVASWRETLPEIDFEARRGWLAAFLREGSHTTIVAERAGVPIGFATWDASRPAYLHQLVVAPEAKGGGLAKVLLDAVKSHAHGGLVLDVNKANARAVRFYEREGFIIASAGTNPRSGLPSWRMAWGERTMSSP